MGSYDDTIIFSAPAALSVCVDNSSSTVIFVPVLRTVKPFTLQSFVILKEPLNKRQKEIGRASCRERV